MARVTTMAPVDHVVLMNLLDFRNFLLRKNVA